MSVTNATSGTRIDEIADGIFRIHTPLSPQIVDGGFSFNQYLIVDDKPLLYHTGPRRMFALVRDAIEHVIPVHTLRYLGLSHFEADECGALNDFLALALEASPLCGTVAAMTSVDDVADRPARALADGAEVCLGRHTVRWMETPHLPHAWECGHLFESSTRTLLCGDLFTQGGAEHEVLTHDDILGPSEKMRAAMDYFAHGRDTRPHLEKLARLEPGTLACMHGAAWAGDGAALLRALANELEG